MKPTLIESARSPRREYLVLIIVLCAIALPVLFLFESYGPSAVPFVVTADGIRVDGLLYPKNFSATDVNVATLRAVNRTHSRSAE